MPISSYDQAVAYWLSRVDYEKIGMPRDMRLLHLGRMERLLAALSNPHHALSVIHIAGTKGKGSTAALLAAILQAAGYRVGLYTSPHLERVEERVQINGQPIAPTCLTELMARIEAAVAAVEAAGEQPPTFFEIITALALLYFAEAKVDHVVLEVGMGGRYDATNVCQPRVAMITSISFDHVAQLGPTLTDIAWAKAGIIKLGRPVVSGATSPEAAQVIRWVASHLTVELFELNRDFFVDYQPGNVTACQWPQLRWRTKTRIGPWLELRLWGQHQADNAALALQAVDLLRQQSIAVSDDAVAEGLQTVRWPARLEIIHRAPWIVLDCAHNPTSIAATRAWFVDHVPARCRQLLLGLSKDKDLPGIIGQLTGYFDRAFLTRYANSQRAADPALLACLWQQSGGGPSWTFESTGEALMAARDCLHPDDALLITGSVFLAGEARRLLAGV